MASGSDPNEATILKKTRKPEWITAASIAAGRAILNSERAVSNETSPRWRSRILNGSLAATKYRKSDSWKIRDSTVAAAAPLSPISGSPNLPKMSP